MGLQSVSKLNFVSYKQLHACLNGFEEKFTFQNNFFISESGKKAILGWFS